MVYVNIVIAQIGNNILLFSYSQSINSLYVKRKKTDTNRQSPNKKKGRALIAFEYIKRFLPVSCQIYVQRTSV